MASITNPHKQFQFDIDIAGMDTMLAQKVTLPSPELDVAEHGDRNYIVKTAGIMKYDTLKVEKISWGGNLYRGENISPSASLSGQGNIWQWVHNIQNVYAGGGALPSEYKATVTVTKYGTDGHTKLGTWRLDGCWPSKINGVELSRVDSENTIESVEFQVDQMTPLIEGSFDESKLVSASGLQG